MLSSRGLMLNLQAAILCLSGDIDDEQTLSGVGCNCNCPMLHQASISWFSYLWIREKGFTISGSWCQSPSWPPVLDPVVASPGDGVSIVYVNMYVAKIYPFLNETPWLQPYKFESVVTLTNMSYSTVEGWAVRLFSSCTRLL